jgi:hypothetical protein
MIERPGALSLSRQCELLGLSRAAFYYQPVEIDAYELELMALIDREAAFTLAYGRPHICFPRLAIVHDLHAHKTADNLHAHKPRTACNRRSAAAA